MLALAGVGTAALLVASTASAWDVNNLPQGCAQDGTLFDAAGPSFSYWIKCGNNRTLIHYGSDPIPNAPTDSNWQGSLDSFVDANYTAPVTTTAAPVATTTDVTTTAPTTTPASPPPVGTTTITQTVTTPTETTTVGVTTTVSLVETDLQRQIDALAAQLAQLTDRVTRLEKAGDASWLAFQQAVAGGADASAAADQARGTWLNVVNQLGAFAPAA